MPGESSGFSSDSDSVNDPSTSTVATELILHHSPAASERRRTIVTHLDESLWAPVDRPKKLKKEAHQKDVLYLLSANVAGLLTCCTIVFMHLLFVSARLLNLMAAPINSYCGISYPPPLRFRFEEGGQLLTTCDILKNLIVSYEEYQRLEPAFPHVYVGKYYCPVFSRLCKRVTAGAIDVDYMLGLDGDLCDLGNWTLDAIAGLCQRLFDDTTFDDDVPPDAQVDPALGPGFTDITDCYRVDLVTIDNDSCPDLYKEIARRPADVPLYLFYGIKPWFSSTHGFRNSFSFEQVNGRPVDLTSPEVKYCDSVMTGLDMRRQIKRAGSASFQVVPSSLIPPLPGAEVLHPCGMKPATIFTDTFHLYQCEPQHCCNQTQMCCSYSTLLAYPYCSQHKTCTCTGVESEMSDPAEGRISFIKNSFDAAYIMDRDTDFYFINPIVPEELINEDGSHPPLETIYNLNDFVKQWLPEWLFPGQIESPHFVNWMNAHDGVSTNDLYVRWSMLATSMISTQSEYPSKESPIHVMIRNRFDTSFYGASKSLHIGDKFFNYSLTVERQRLITGLMLILDVAALVILSSIMMYSQIWYSPPTPLVGDEEGGCCERRPDCKHSPIDSDDWCTSRDDLHSRLSSLQTSYYNSEDIGSVISTATQF